MKQVVFIAGTAYSGSSMLDMMIGNTESSFSMGEIQFLFKPLKLHHINPPCGCGDGNCTLWSEVKEKGASNLYVSIFNRYENITTIVDSSKDPFWIDYQHKCLIKHGILSKVLLIWKSPIEFAISRYKRGQLVGWDRAWIKYHRLFFSLVKQWKSVEYHCLATKPAQTLRYICDYLSIPYKKKMEEFWLKRHHMLFGNLSAKYHTYDKDIDKYENTYNHLKSLESNAMENKHRTIFYDSKMADELPSYVKNDAKNSIIDDITSAIIHHSIDGENNYSSSSGDDTDRLVYSKPLVNIYLSKMIFRELLFKICHRK